jgi:hypothetical protein
VRNEFNVRDDHDHDDGDRRLWVSPTSVYRGSVVELVQIAKSSGRSDCSGHRRDGTGTHC